MKLSDSILPLLILLIVAMILLPLSLWMLDCLLIANLSFSLFLLVSVVLLAQPDRFTSLPAILLFATLFRLGLNISTTRSLLAGGHAPQVVETFGNFVAAGNIVVGVVVFAIIAVIQFLVVAKGAERVAEVAARFALDAMPGKQMAIDAELRAGVISAEFAREKREILSRESKLYGAMDGAMKFVKGDAIAGLLITLINFCAGVLLGVTQQNLSISDSFSRYSIYTIGDGLVSQLPALLLAIAAGIVVTRVSEKPTLSLNKEVVGQLLESPLALFFTAALLLLFSFLPGLPLLPFLLLACFFFFVARSSQERQKAVEIQQNPGALFKPSSLISLSLSRELESEKCSRELLADVLLQLKARLYQEWGVFLPVVSVEFALEEGSRTVLEIAGREIVLEVEAASLESHESWVNLLVPYITKHIHLLMNDSQTRLLLELNRSSLAELTQSLIPERISLTELTAVFKELLLEKVPITAPQLILQAIAEYEFCSEHRDSFELHSEGKRYLKHQGMTSHVRLFLAKQILKVTLREQKETVQFYVLDDESDLAISQAIIERKPIRPELLLALIKSAKTLSSSVVIASKWSRAFLADAFRDAKVEVSVLAIEELAAHEKSLETVVFSPSY